MSCPECGQANPADARFCNACGSRLVLTCPSCKQPNAPASRFCNACGQKLSETEGPAPASYTPKHLADKILTSKDALEGERKLVTVLFADVAGFTAMSERLDPEDVHQLMDRAFELMLAEIHRYEGTVNQFLGDGLMALFGAPIAHEDHAVRAVHAALGIQRALATYREQLARERGIEFRVRMGLNTGAVVVGRIGDNLRMDYTAVGDTTNLAARILGLAQPGDVLIGPDTAKAVGPYFTLEPLGEVAVKGKALPVRPFRVRAARGVQGRIEALLERGLTPLVGRERELALLVDRFAEVQAGHGQAVFVFGEAGIGKSRLLAEFRRSTDAADARWLVGRCVSYGRAISYLPVLDLIRELLGIGEADPVDVIAGRVDASVGDLGPEATWMRPFVRALLSLDPGDPEVVAMNPHQRRGRIVDAVRALLHLESRRRPLVLFIEDLHWIDPHSEEVLRLLLEGVATVPVLVLLTHRPGYSPPFGDRTYYSRIPLHSLLAAQTSTLVDRVLAATDIPLDVRDLIVRKTEGNPLYVEELTKALVEEGTLARANGGYRLARTLDDVHVPDTIQAVIMARIDRLPTAAKTALQVASVIGREFTARLVERVATFGGDAAEALGELRAVELIYEKSLYPELAYMFKHALTHDVAYESLLRQRRRALHRRAAEVIEELYPDRLREFYETLAWHYVRGETWDRAMHYLLAAAEKARAHYAYGEAIRHCTDAIAILDRHGGAGAMKASACEMLGILESRRGHVAQGNAAYERALEVADDPAVRQRIENLRHRPGAVVRDGGRVAYYEHGRGEPTLVLMHPQFYGMGTYQPLLESLCQEFRVITVDARGSGASDPLPSGYQLADHAEDARAVIEGTSTGPIVLIGISMAARLVIRVAATYPHLVHKLVIVGGTHGATPPPPAAWRPRVVSLIREHRYEEAMREFWPVVVSEPGGRDLVETMVQSSLELSPDVVDNIFLLGDPSRNVQALLPAVRVSSLVLHGDADIAAPYEMGVELAEQIAGAQLYTFKGRGHALYNTATAEFVQVVRSFIHTGRPVEAQTIPTTSSA
jgi:class 3 adenylate cyclase/pimeloyl-ACP methyl ester carboxylesterase